MAVFADRLECEYLRLDLGLEVEDHAYDAGLVATGAYRCDEWIVGQKLAGEFLLHAGEVEVLDVEHQAFGIFYRQ